MNSGPPGRYLFDRYEFDIHSGELLRDGSRMRLPEQNARLLALLLQRSGSLIERSELRSEMWPTGEHLNHDHAISNGINQLRYALRDNPRVPVFIETLPKRGYRFIAKVRFEAAIAPALTSPEEAEQDSTLASVKELMPTPATSAASYRWGLSSVLFLGMLVCVGGILGFLLLRHSAVSVSTGSKNVILAIAPIRTTGSLAQELAEPFRLELTDAASQLPGVHVRAANSVGTFPVDPASLRKFAGELQVQVLLVGEMKSFGNDLDMSFELLRGSDTVHLASFHYKGTQDALGRIRSEMERDLFRTLSDTQHNQLNPLHSTDNVQAYRDYLTARRLLAEHSDDSIAQATKGFRDAIAQDNGFAQAYSGLGSASLLLAEHASGKKKEENYAAAREAAQQSISLNPRVAEAHATLGFLLFRHDWNAAAAEPELKRAIELEPGQAMHRIMYALLLGNTGRLPEALQQMDRARAADTLWPPVYLTEAYLAAAARQNSRALEACDMALRLKPGWALAHDQNAWALWYTGRAEDAVEEWLRMAELEHDGPRIELERHGLRVLHESGIRAYSRLKLDAALSKTQWRHTNDFQLAEWELNTGEREKTLVSLQVMITARDPDSLQIGTSPAYFALHGDPEFRELLRQIQAMSPR